MVRNSQPISIRRYLQVTEEHYARAVQDTLAQAAQKAAQYPAAMSCKESQVEPAINRKPRKLRGFASCCNSLQDNILGRSGLEPVDITNCRNCTLQDQTKTGDAKSDAPSTDFDSESLSRLLTEIIHMLSELSPEVKAKLIDMLKDSTKDKG